MMVFAEGKKLIGRLEGDICPNTSMTEEKIPLFHGLRAQNNLTNETNLPFARGITKTKLEYRICRQGSPGTLSPKGLGSEFPIPIYRGFQGVPNLPIINS